jgi:hypothetical protein
MKAIKILLIVGVALGGLFLVAIVLCAGGLFYSFREMDAAISPRVDELFAAIEAETFAQTYDTHTSAELRNVSSREQYGQIGSTIKTRLGALQSKQLVRFNVRVLNGARVADVVYSGKFEHGAGTISVKMKKEGEQWVFVGFNVNSPEFNKDLATGKCPHCGQPHSSGAKFCSKCGKPLIAEDKATEEQAKEVVTP